METFIIITLALILLFCLLRQRLVSNSFEEKQQKKIQDWKEKAHLVPDENLWEARNAMQSKLQYLDVGNARCETLEIIGIIDAEIARRKKQNN